jgi:filamentous hemagglutinin family protein
MRYLLTIFMLCWISASHAEIITDGSLGARLSLPGSNYEITPELGQQLGGNLFHSFDKFNIHAGESATFSGATSVQNIIGRVTGGSASTIDGILRTSIPNADLYLLNPNGILFGRNAKLEVQGSFHASTADTLRLGDGGNFNAKYPNDSLLVSAPPTAFGFLTDTPAAISSEGAQLVVTTGKTLSLIAGDMALYPSFLDEKAQLTKISAVNGRVNLTSSRGVGDVTLTANDVIMQTQPADMQLKSVQLSSNDGGSIYIRSGEFVLDNSLISLLVGAKPGGWLDIKARNVILSNGARISTTALVASAGNISIQATDTIRLSGQDSQNLGSYIASNTRSKNKAGAGGTMILQARRLELKDGGKLSASSFGAGDGGEIQLDISEEIVMDGADKQTPSSIYMVASDSGKGGTLKLQTDRLNLLNGTYLGADAKSTGTGGDISIVAREVTLQGVSGSGSGSFISSNTLGTVDGAGKGGEINLQAEQLTLKEGGQISASTLGQGAGGKINIASSQNITLSGQDNTGLHSGVFSVAGTEATGHAGQIAIQAQDMLIKDLGELNAGTRGKGKGGDVNVTAQRIQINSGGRITARSTGTGDAGTVTLKVSDTLLLDDASVETKTESAAGGSLFISVPKTLYLWNSKITTSVHGGVGNGGDITIDQPKFVILNNAKTIAQADAGRGGNINIISSEFVRSTESLVSASSRLGIDGNVFISAPDADLSGDLIILSTDFLNADALLKTPCSQMDSESLGSLVVAHREGVPNYQDDLLPSTPIFSAITPAKVALTTNSSENPSTYPLIQKSSLACHLALNAQANW